MPRVTFKPVHVLASALALVAAYFAWLDATAAVMYRINPALVVRLKPGDPQSLSVAVDQRTLAKSITQPSPEDARRLAKTLVARPLSASTLRQLAMADQLEGNSPKAARLLDLSDRVSRRELLTELLLSNSAAQHGQPEVAMRHFAAALSTQPEALSLLFPPLANTLRQARFQPVIARYLDREWAPAFLDYAVRHADPADLLAAVQANPAVQREDRFHRFRGDLIVNLVRAGHPALAFAYAAKVPAEDSAALKIVGFNRRTTEPGLGPLLWRLGNSGGVYASLAGPTVLVDIDPASTGLALERIFALAPGSYTIGATTKAVDLSEDLSAEWQAECLRGEEMTVLGRWKAQVASSAQRARLPIRVDSLCEGVRVTLTVHNLDDQQDAEVEVSDFELAKGGP
jgi:hypothetical protein